MPAELRYSVQRFLQASWARWALFVAGWTLLSLLFVPEAYLFFLYRGDSIPISRIAALTLANAGIVLLFLPAIIWLARKYPIEQRTWPKALLVHIPACLLFSLSHSWLYAALCYASPGMFHMLFIRFHPNLLTYWAVVGFTQAGDYFRRYTERERQLAQAELHLLRAQLQPHFLFNSLNTIAAMMHEDVQAADRMINRLSDLLRLVLSGIGKHETTLQEELSLLCAYLDIERIRFQERLSVRLQIDAEALDALVPSMIFQPLAENAIRHGFGDFRDSGTITVSVARLHDRIRISFSDNGCGASEPLRFRGEGLGLANTRRRLEQLYPSDHYLEVGNAPDGGFRVTIELPHHTVMFKQAELIGELMEDENSHTDRGRRAVGEKAHRYAAQN